MEIRSVSFARSIAAQKVMAKRVWATVEILAYSHIGHDCQVGDLVVFSNNGTLAGHVEVGDHAVMGGLTAVHQFCRIGWFAITGGCSKISSRTCPPFSSRTVTRLKFVGSIWLEWAARVGFPPESVKAIRKRSGCFTGSKLNTRQAIVVVWKKLNRAEEISQLLEFIEKSERGIIPIRDDLNNAALAVVEAA